MSALLAIAVPDDAGYEEDLRSAAAWRDAVRAGALARPKHAPGLPPRWRRWGWLLALALHLALLIGLRSALREQPVASEAMVVSVRLIDAPAEPKTLSAL